jgi:hypothetical protein
MGLNNSKVLSGLGMDFVDRFNLLNILEVYKFEELVVSGNFEIENGVIGLNRNVYLCIVKFLHSSILRKVLVTFFF